MDLHRAKRQSTMLADNEAAFVSFKTIPIESIVVGKRIRDDPTKRIDLLVNSIKAYGLLHPIIVRQQEGNGKGLYFLLAGERRLEAFKSMGRREIPAHIHRRALGSTMHKELI